MGLISEMFAFALHRLLATHLLTLMTHNNTAKSILNMLELLLKVASIYMLRHAFTSTVRAVRFELRESQCVKGAFAKYVVFL